MRLIIILLFLLFPTSAFAGFTKAQTGVTNTSSSGTTLSCTLGGNPAAGDLVIVGILWFNGTPSSVNMTVADSNGNNYTVDGHNSGTTNYTAGEALQAYLLYAPANASKTITATVDIAANGAFQIWCDDFTVTGGRAAYDSGAVGSGTHVINTPAVPVSGSNELLYAVATDVATVTGVTGPWTLSDGGIGGYGCGTEWILNASSNTNVGFSGTNGAAYNAIGMSFKIVTSINVLHMGGGKIGHARIGF